MSDTAAQLQHIESQLEALRALLVRQARIVHVACYKSSECSSHLQCAFFFYSVLFRGGVSAPVLDIAASVFSVSCLVFSKRSAMFVSGIVL